MDDYVEATQLPLDKRRAAVEVIEARFDAVSKTDFLLGHVMLSLARFEAVNLRGIACLHAARTALAIERYRLAAGRLPDALSDLVPAYLDFVPKDPFDSNDLRYKKLDPGFVVYSIGDDLSDDGGKEKPSKTTKGGKSVNWDVTFIVER